VSEANKKIVQRFYKEIWNEGKLDVADEVFAPHFLGEAPGSAGTHGPAEVKQFVGNYRTGFPDLNVKIDDQIAEGDLVGSRFTITGTHRGNFMGIPPTNKWIQITGMAMTRIENGMVVADRGEFDMIAAFQQLGLVPARPPGGPGGPGGPPPGGPGGPPAR
jgi:steroid delta-isomerase-like uncharacterized protein